MLYSSSIKFPPYHIWHNQEKNVMKFEQLVTKMMEETTTSSSEEEFGNVLDQVKPYSTEEKEEAPEPAKSVVSEAQEQLEGRLSHHSSVDDRARIPESRLISPTDSI